jgi:cell division protein FtsW
MGLKNSHKILVITLCLLCFGIIMVYSSSFLRAEASKLQDGYYFFKKQLLLMVISFIVMLVTSKIPYQTWSRLSPLLLIITWLLLILVLIPWIGHIAGGAKRWLRIGPVGFQPSELAKICLVIFIAAFASRYPEQVRSFTKGFIPLGLVIGITVFLVLLEPDIGTSLFIVLITGILLIIAGLRITHLVPVGLVICPIVLYILASSYPHIQNRLSVFFNPTADTGGKGYQINQAIIGLGAGGITGHGLGLSYQKLFYLPQQHTDFIFSIIGEELGLIGTLLVLGLFFALLWYGRKVAASALDGFGSLLAIGITLVIVLQALFNISVVCALVPTKGISLPFISYGGSGLLVFMFALGILLNIARQSEKARASQTALFTSHK